MKKILMIVLVSCSLFAYDATVEIVKKMDKLPKIALQDASESSVDLSFRKKFFKILVGDLRVSSHFNVVDEYLQSSYKGNLEENFLNELNLDLILRYRILFEYDGIVIAEVKVINAKTGQVDSERTYKISKHNRYPLLAHNIAVELNAKIGAPSIKWMDQYVIFAKYIGSKKSEIIISDYTLSFQQTVVKGGLNIFPKWANKAQNAFYYTSYNGNKPTLYKVDVRSGKRKRILSSPGMLVCSDVSADGDKLLLTMAPNDQADIYVYDINRKNLEKITSYSGIDVNGNFIDNDKRVVFVSDRLGYPNIFAQQIGSRSVEQMVYHGKNNNSVSAIDNYIVYSSREKSSEFGPKTFNLYLISTKTDYIRQLTATGKNLYPRFADDSETIMFIKYYNNQSALGLIRLNANKSYHFPLKVGKIQSIDW
ncbi:Tol-Pal system protein TolB [Sulfurospirillum arcachonense]|uniref:Tol-Pal system protein TolB n=1 Tax=Sulfurospirillum arcachonense TaxID=57666 RepID=UPI00046A3A75|nr:Tol-Pal system protein TolB [Sulfurospirillum arcachonense]